jgi:pyruvate kinase
MPTHETPTEGLIAELETLINHAQALEQKFAPALERVHPVWRKSAQNLIHYLAFRQNDIRTLQEQLAQLGLSSLGRAESHVLASLEAVREQLYFRAQLAPVPQNKGVPFKESKEALAIHTEALLGPVPKDRSTRLMVTLSAEMATDFQLLVHLLQAGMNCARINCAYDDSGTWLTMIENIKKAKKETGLPCKILMDLMGPRIRTGPLEAGPRVVAIHPAHDALGEVAAPAKVWLAPPSVPTPKEADATLPVDGAWIDQIQEGQTIAFTDTRGRKRTLSVVRKKKKGLMAHLLKTSYIATGSSLQAKNAKTGLITTNVGELPASVLPIFLKKGDALLVHRALIPGEPARFDESGRVVAPAHISCTLPEVFDQVKKGQPILFDDGAIEGIIEQVTRDGLLVKIIFAKDQGSKLRADKGINLPESRLLLRGLTLKDQEDLKFALQHADIVNLSFVNDPEMVKDFLAEIRQLTSKAPAIMLKIETKEGFRHLPSILLAAMGHYPLGVMIARGDLAVECGWQRLAEVQEEMLWLCEAAHVPVVWATQVLETLAKKGRPSRAEITDAAMAQRADCVMLNKGPHIVPATRMLTDILERMEAHQQKKTPLLRRLEVSEIKLEAGMG